MIHRTIQVHPTRHGRIAAGGPEFENAPVDADASLQAHAHPRWPSPATERAA